MFVTWLWTTTWSGRCMTYWLGALQDKLPSYQVSWRLALWQWRCNGFSLSRDISRSCDERVMWLYGWQPVKVSYRPAKFGGHRHCGSGNIMFLVAEDETSRCSRFIPPLLFNFSRTWVESARHIILLTLILVTRSQSSNWTNTGK